VKFRVCMSQFTSLICCDNIVYRDGKEPSQSSLLGFGSVRVLTKVRVRFGSVRVLHKCRTFGFGSGSGSVLIFSVLSSVRFYMSSTVWQF